MRGSCYRAYIPCRELSYTVAAYLAGIIDADGHIALYKHSTGHPRLVLTVSNTNTTMLDWISEQTGVGKRYLQAKERPKYKATWNWVTGGPAGASVLREIRPYMIVKAERADLAIEYDAGLQADKRDDLVWRDEQRVKMLALNKR